MRFGAVPLDLDGCLIDSNDAHSRAWSRALRAFGLRVRPSAIRIHFGKGGAELLRDFLPPAAHHFVSDALGATETRLFLARFSREVRPLPGAAGTVREMRRAGIPVVLASSADRKVGDRSLARLRAGRSGSAFPCSAEIAARSSSPRDPRSS